MTDAHQNQKDSDREARIAKCLEDNPDLTERLVEDILLGIEELNRGESTAYQFS